MLKKEKGSDRVLSGAGKFCNSGCCKDGYGTIWGRVWNRACVMQLVRVSFNSVNGQAPPKPNASFSLVGCLTGIESSGRERIVVEEETVDNKDETHQRLPWPLKDLSSKLDFGANRLGRPALPQQKSHHHATIDYWYR